MKKHKFSVRDRILMTLHAFSAAGTLLKGFGAHFNKIKQSFHGVLPYTRILPQAILFFDAFLAFLSFFTSIYMLIGNEFLEYTPAFILKNMVVYVLTSTSIFLWMQTHRVLWRFFSLEDLIPLIMSVFMSSIVYFPLMKLLAQQEALPSSLPFVNAVVYIVMLSLPRYIYKTMYDRQSVQKKQILEEQNVPVILAGSANSAELFIREVMHSPALSYEPVAILSPDLDEKGCKVHAIPILNFAQNWDALLKEIRSLPKRPVQIVITDTNLPHNFLKVLSTLSQRCTLPTMQMIPQFNIEMTESHIESSIQFQD